MADEAKSKIDAATEKAYAEASAATSGKAAPVTAPEKAPVTPAAKVEEAKSEPAPKEAVAKAASKTVAKKPAPKKAKLKASTAKKPVARKLAAPKKKKPVARKAAPAKVAARKAAAAPRTNTLTELKDTIMAKTNTKDFTKTVKETAADMQAKMKTAYDKGSEYVSEAVEFNKANLEAIVASGKVLAGGMQDMARDGVEDTKAVFSTFTADAKKMAAVKSPTELFQLQGELARRNFDAMVAYGSKNTEKMIKLANDAFAPVSSRMSVAAEKISKAA